MEILKNLGVNISDSSAPNAPGVDESVDAHIVTTTHDFTWPGSGNVPTELDEPNSGLCLTVADSPNDWPVNVTNAYTEDDADNPSCAPVLGQPCVDAILSSSRRNGFVGCNGPSTSWFHLPECQSTLGYTRGMSTPVGTPVGTFTQPYGFSNTSRNATDDQKHGKGFSPITLSSSPQDGSGSVEYYTILNRLHIMLFNPIIPSNGASESRGATGYTQGPALLCMRVNTTQLPTGDTDGDGVTWTSEAVLESIGSSVNRSAVWVWSVVTFMSLTLAFAT